MVRIMSRIIKSLEAIRETEKLEKQFIKEFQALNSKTLADIEGVISRYYNRYSQEGVLRTNIMAQTIRRPTGTITRQEALLDEVDSKVSEHNRGTPQKIAGFLAVVYLLNVHKSVENVYNITPSISASTVKKVLSKIPSRQAAYQAALNPLSKIGLQDNAFAVRQKIRRSIVSGIQQGKSIDKMAEKIAKALETNANNATRIARTETTRNMNAGRLSAYEELAAEGISLKKVWIATNDSRTRDWHSALNEEARELNEPFSNGLMFPGDPGGGADEVINCRCTMATEIIE